MFSRSLNKDLYGPSRISANTEIKNVLLRDHVLQKGEWHENVQRNPWATSFAISFKKPSSEKSAQHIKDVQKNVTSFVLGSGEGPLLATTAKDFDDKIQGVPEKAAPSQSTSIADFAPKYMSDKSFGKSGSVYFNSFAKKGQGSHAASSVKNRTECQEHTTDLNTTHFKFGTDFNGYGTETMSSFRNKSGHSSHQPGLTSSKAAFETYKSSVFRNGDWNVAQPCISRHSVTRSDFHIKPFSTLAEEPSGKTELEEEKVNSENETEELPVDPKDDPAHPYYQRSTHFVLGDNADERSSLYYQDFMLGTRKCLLKPLPAPPPISSKVLPTLEDCLPMRSTNTADFVDHMTHLKKIGQGRAAETKLNRERHNNVTVVLSCDERRHAGDRQASMTGADYPHPPRDDVEYLSPRRAPRSKYRYLDSDGALFKIPVWPMPSETKEEFIPIEEATAGDALLKYKDKKADCEERIQDNKSTHFQFGSDGELRHSEQHDQFLSSLRLDPSLPAAGKTEGPEQKYSHVYPSESSEGVGQSVSSSRPLDQVAMIQSHMQQLSQQRYFNPRDPMNINLRKAFLEFDTSLSGTISKEDLKNVLSKLGINLDVATLEKLFEICDKNHSGYIDYQEFAKHLTRDLPLSRGTKPPSSSVMKTDFCPPEQRRFTSAQQRTIEMSKKIVPLSVSSHYFHKHHTGAPRLSTTAQDFVRPDRMPGSPRISAR